MLGKDFILTLGLLLTIAFIVFSYYLLQEDKKPSKGKDEFRNNFLAIPYLVLFIVDILFSGFVILNNSGLIMYLSLVNILIVFFVFYWHERSLQNFYYSQD